MPRASRRSRSAAPSFTRSTAAPCPEFISAFTGNGRWLTGVEDADSIYSVNAKRTEAIRYPLLLVSRRLKRLYPSLKKETVNDRLRSIASPALARPLQAWG